MSNDIRTVFVGNIPYDLTEESIIQLFSTVGTVTNFRLVHDNETGRPKGFGFAEFADADAAASAIRNLDKHPIMGRELKVDYSKAGGKDDAVPANYVPVPDNNLPNGLNPPTAAQPLPGASSLPALPQGIELQPGVTFSDAISTTLQTLPPGQLLDVLSQMKELAMADPERAAELFNQAPQLGFAIFQALMLMGLVDPSVLSSVVEQASQQQQPAQPPVPQWAQQQQLGYPNHAPTPPVYQQPFQPPAPAPGQPPAIPADLLQQVLRMTQAELDRLPPGDREPLLTLRAQYANGFP